MPEDACRKETNVGRIGGLHLTTTLCIRDEAACCAEDMNHAKAAEWLCDDKCSTCSCSGGTVAATGCAKHSGAADQPPEAYFVQLALVVVAVCFVAGAAVCWIMLCCKRKAQLLPSKEMKSPEEEEEDQLAAGD